VSFDPTLWRPAPLLPARTARPFWLLWLMAALCCVAGLALVACVIVARADQAATPRLSGQITVAAAPSALESADAAAARAAEMIGQTPGVASTRVLDPAPIDRLIGAVLWAPAKAPAGGAGRLITVAYAPGARPDSAALVRALRAQEISARIDDHGAWSGPVERARLLSGLGLAIVLMATLAAIFGAATAAARSGLMLQRDRFRLMHRMGATDGYLAGLLSRAVSAGVIAGAIIGAGTAGALAYWALRHGLRGPIAGLKLDIGYWALLAVLPVPPIAAGIGAIAGRRAAMAVVRRFP